MSLFNTLDFWSTRCGINENFSFESMIVTDLNESGCDVIIVGSLSGLLRVYQPISDDTDRSFKPSHLLLEIQLPSPIIQVFVGKFVSGTRALHIGVVLPTRICVYNVVTTPGSTDHGNQFSLKLIYEHSLQHTNFFVVYGPFGGVKGRDFLCAISIDGIMSFFEQETFVFKTQLPSFLLPSSIVYVEEADTFVTLSVDWCIEGYRYQDLVNTGKKKVVSNWTYNLGENILCIRVIKHHLQKEAFIVVLSERNLTCFGANGGVKFTKRLQYSPFCFYCYLSESSYNLMTLIVSDGGVVYVYESKRLVWSAKLPILPICISRGNTMVNGSLVLLSDQGDLQCCYLGTKPSLFVTPPLENSVVSFKNMNSRLEVLQDEIKNFRNTNADNILTSTTVEHELSLTIKMQSFDKAFHEYRIQVSLMPSHPLTNIHISFEVATPFEVHPNNYAVASLCKKTELGALIRISKLISVIPSSLDLNVIVCYSNGDMVRVLQRSKTISPRLVLIPCSVTEDKCQFRICIETNKTPPLLTTIFQEFHDDSWLESSCNEKSVGFCLRYNTELKCLVTLSKLKLGFDFIGNSLPLMQFLLYLITWKCKNFKISSEKSDEEFFFCCRSLPRDELLDCISRRVTIRNEIRDLQLFLEKLSAQFRLIQRRLLIKLKDKNFSNITTIQTLYQNTHEKLIETIRTIENKQSELVSCSCELQSVMNLIIDLISLGDSGSAEKIKKFRNAICMSEVLGTQDWETRTLANLTHLLRTTLASINSDHHRLLPSSEEIVVDPSVLKNLIATALERISNQFPKVEKSEKSRIVAPIFEDDEYDESSSQESSVTHTKSKNLMLNHQLFENEVSADTLGEVAEEF